MRDPDPIVETNLSADAVTREPNLDVTLTQDSVHLAAVLAEAKTASAPFQAVPNSLGGYRIEQLLGEGGMGAVYLARDEQLSRPIAIKTIKPLHTHPASIARFLREARASARIDHDNVVPIWHVGTDADIPFIAMPLLRGESLATRLERDPVQSVTVAVKIGRETAEGLAAAHALGITHRDIKPANLWLEAPPIGTLLPEIGFTRVKILDFGLARISDDIQLTAEGATMGTPAYMSPEQAKGEAVDHRTDLFSLGSVLYRMLTGILPFPGSNTLAVLSALASDIPPPVASVNAEVPPALAGLIDRLLSKDPNDRPASAREVADCLANPDLLVERPHTPTSAHARRPPILTRRWKIIGTAIGVIVLLPTGIVLLDSKVPPARTPASEPVASPHSEAVKPNIVPQVTDSTKERQAAEWAVKTGAIVSVNYSNGTGKMVTKVEEVPSQPFRVTSITFGSNSSPVTDEGIKNLRGLSGITHLHLSPYTSKVTDAGVENLAGLASLTDLHLAGDATEKCIGLLTRLPALRNLSLPQTASSDESLRQLATHSGLQTLRLIGGGRKTVTDEGLKHLTGMAGLKELSLRMTRVTGTGLSSLAGLRCLTQLDLSDNPLTAEGFKNLAQLHTVEQIWLNGVLVNHESLADVAKLPNLTMLSLRNTPLTDDWLVVLVEAKKLKDLDATASKVTASGIEAFRKKLPNCNAAGP
ncbi:MAG: hypothetical protein C0467_19090 [Planctomycetaceae bacterium]|nr:hypothetical protein [Planctomycetaceae bacterium]